MVLSGCRGRPARLPRHQRLHPAGIRSTAGLADRRGPTADPLIPHRHAPGSRFTGARRWCSATVQSVRLHPAPDFVRACSAFIKAMARPPVTRDDAAALSGNLCRCPATAHPGRRAERWRTTIRAVNGPELLLKLEQLTAISTTGCLPDQRKRTICAGPACCALRRAHPDARSWPAAPMWGCGSQAAPRLLRRCSILTAWRNCAAWASRTTSPSAPPSR